MMCGIYFVFNALFELLTNNYVTLCVFFFGTEKTNAKSYAADNIIMG